MKIYAALLALFSYGCGAACGDGEQDTNEACDDGNVVSGDGCRADCAGLEVCGDGLVDAGQLCTAAPQNFAVGATPNESIVADLNQDGFGDIISANADIADAVAQDTISILINNGDGTFNPQITINVGVSPSSIAARDFNSDGNLDLAVSNAGSSDVSVLLGGGDGTFAAQTTFAVGAFPTKILAEDFDQDGAIDLAVMNRDDGTVSVLGGVGDGTFDAQVTFDVSTFCFTGDTADIDSDGDLDLVVSAQGQGDFVSILLGAGDGSFSAPNQIPAGGGVLSVFARDINNDSLVDIVILAAAPIFSFQSFLGDGTGQFAAPINVTGKNPFAISLGDINNDGALDLLEASPSVNGNDPGETNVYINDGAGNFGTPPTAFAAGAVPINVTVADINNDEATDLITTNASDNNLTVVLSTP